LKPTSRLKGDDHRREQVRQDVAREDDGIAGAQRAGGLDELALASDSTIPRTSRV
jgi:hypothetical protein